MARSKSSLEGAIIIPAPVLANALGWTLNVTKRYLMDKGIFRKKHTGRYGRVYTTTALLMQVEPETAPMILAAIAARGGTPKPWLRASAA